MFYLVLYALFFVVAVCNYYSFRKNEIALSNVLYYGYVFLLFIVGAFRFETGGDWPGYKLMYDELSGEPLFRTIIYIAHVFGHYQYIFVLTELIRFAILIYIIDSQFKSAPQYKMLFVLLYYSMYFFYYDMVIVRQQRRLYLLTVFSRIEMVILRHICFGLFWRRCSIFRLLCYFLCIIRCIG